MQQWKEAVGLRYHFTCADSPDLQPLDSLWPLGKKWKLTEPLRDWDDDTLREAAGVVWREMMTQDKVNMWVEFMPSRLREPVRADGGLMTW